MCYFNVLTVTPYKFTANVTEQPFSTKKPKFDLKASLAKPTSWSTHKGKLNAFKFENIYHKDIKEVKVKTK